VTTAPPIRVGVIGLGLIAQVVHLPNLRRLADRYMVTHVCDLSPTVVRTIATRLAGPPRWTTDPAVLLADAEVDAVVILTPGAHAPLAGQALDAGKHVMSEKPMCLTQAEARELAAKARASGRVLQVGYMKLHDPSMAPAREAIAGIGEVRLVRITVRHPSDARQTDHLGVLRARDADPAVIAAAIAYEEARTHDALGDAADELGGLYRDVLMGSICHELSAMRGLGLPLPARFRNAHTWHRPGDGPGEPPSVQATAALEGGALLELDWLWLPDYPSYRERISIIGTAGEVTLEMPEPYGHQVAAGLTVELPDGADTRAIAHHRVHDSGFLEELRAFHAAVVDGAPPRSDIEGARLDTACLQALAAAIGRDRGIAVGGEAAAGSEAAAGKAAAA
jgi:predicted dehydrogenase